VRHYTISVVALVFFLIVFIKRNCLSDMVYWVPVGVVSLHFYLYVLDLNGSTQDKSMSSEKPLDLVAAEFLAHM
jgi:hypothetical protein